MGFFSGPASPRRAFSGLRISGSGVLGLSVSDFLWVPSLKCMEDPPQGAFQCLAVVGTCVSDSEPCNPKHYAGKHAKPCRILAKPFDVELLWHSKIKSHNHVKSTAPSSTWSLSSHETSSPVAQSRRRLAFAHPSLCRARRHWSSVEGGQHSSWAAAFIEVSFLL